jgi:chromosome segregation ATPase
MGLSSTPKEQVTIAQLMVECIGILKRMKDGDLEKMAKEAFALPEREQERANEARAKIATYEGLIAECKAKLADIEKANSDLSAKEMANMALMRKIDEENAKLSVRKDDLDDFSAALNLKATDLQTRERDLAAGKSKLASDNAALDNREAAIAAQEARVKAVAESLKGATQGL